MININNEFEVGEKVHDDLTNTTVVIVGITFQRGRKGLKAMAYCIDTLGYWVDNDYLGGGRHLWELSKIK
jgi:hypothetical protein